MGFRVDFCDYQQWINMQWDNSGVYEYQRWISDYALRIIETALEECQCDHGDSALGMDCPTPVNIQKVEIIQFENGSANISLFWVSSEPGLSILTDCSTLLANTGFHKLLNSCHIFWEGQNLISVHTDDSHCYIEVAKDSLKRLSHKANFW